MSCTNDDIYQEEENDNNNLIIESVRDNLPCEFDFSIYSTNDEILIGCNYDLNGQTITFPENITLKYDGGLLTNGTIILDGGHIDGKLLNIDLEVEGSARLISSDFLFEKEKWNIIEGLVSTSEALTNRKNINIAIGQVSSLRGYTFEVNNLDAYFDIGAINFGNLIHREAIRIPSNFHFKMGNDCTLRVQPTDQIGYAVLSARSANNVKITGGRLLGDKYEHTYATGTELDTHEFGFGIYFVGVTNSIIDGVFIDNMTGDSFAVHATGARNPDGTKNPSKDYSENIIIRNSTLSGARRNNISLIDVVGLVLEDCIISNAGEGGSYNAAEEGRSWKGTAPRSGIDLEARRNWDTENNTLNESQKVSEIIIRRCEFTNSFGSDIILFTCDNVEIYDCTFDSAISTTYLAQDVKIHDNIMTASTSDGGHIQYGVKISSYISPNTQEEFVKNIDLYNNTISGFEIGIVLGGDDHKIYNNTIENIIKTGILIKNGNNNHFYDNNISSQLPNTKGYYQSTNVITNNMTLTRETIDVDYYGLLFKGLSADPTNQLIIDDSSFEGGFRNVDIRNSSNITLKNSQTGTIYQTNNQNVTLSNNN